MKIIIILLSFTIYIPSAFSWEWSGKAFKESMVKYKQTLQKWTDNPEEIGRSINERYTPTYDVLSKTIKTKSAQIESSEAYLVLRNTGNKLEKYGGVSSQEQFFRYLSNDTSDGAKWLYYNYEKIPLIGPFKREFDSRYDHLYYQSIFFTPIIKREAYRFIPR